MIEEFIQLGDLVEHRGVVIAPLFPQRQPVAEYVTLEEAIPLGFHVGEIDAAGSVPELVARNPLDANVLLYDGEELVGAKQNRILNVTVLVDGRSKTLIPVSCVEEGRWSHSTAAFSPGSSHSYPELRRVKAHQLSASPLARGAAQGAVWDEVRGKAARLGVDSDTGAQSDIFAARTAALGGLRDAFPPVPGQAGALFAVGDRLCLDYLSRPDAFARLYPKLLDGYLLDAIENLDRPPAGEERLAGFVAAADAAPSKREPSAGLGEDLRLAGTGVVGSGLTLDDELLQLSVFNSDDDYPPRTRVARPSRRH
jgi:hypothetical protein